MKSPRYPILSEGRDSRELEILTGGPGPPSAPPIGEMPPPPPYTPHWGNIYEAIEPKPRHRWLFRLALSQVLMGVSAMAAALVCILETKYCPYYTGSWVGPLYIVTAISGILAAKRGSINFLVGHLILCVLSCVGSAILIGASVTNWLAIGVFPYEKENPVYCTLDMHDHTLIKYIYEHQSEFDFSRCVTELKLGLSMNSLLVFFGAIQGLLTLTSAVLCCRRTCHCPKCSR